VPKVTEWLCSKTESTSSGLLQNQRWGNGETPGNDWGVEKEYFWDQTKGGKSKTQFSKGRKTRQSLAVGWKKLEGGGKKEIKLFAGKKSYHSAFVTSNEFSQKGKGEEINGPLGGGTSAVQHYKRKWKAGKCDEKVSLLRVIDVKEEKGGRQFKRRTGGRGTLGQVANAPVFTDRRVLTQKCPTGANLQKKGNG